jgi:SNF2 family DNA or RNA helicase
MCSLRGEGVAISSTTRARLHLYRVLCALLMYSYPRMCSFVVHTCIHTHSYNLVVLDSKFFSRLRFGYLILDEAHAIKNAQSQRWQSLLLLPCRNRLLLTGTPIQNSMAELWALLHFIMPDFFDNHDEFSNWFSKDVEDQAQANSKKVMNNEQLQRLHMILKPFMLRRVKRDVESEMPPKIEIEVACGLSPLQQSYYDKLARSVALELYGHSDTTDSLMNLVMQFRKVKCPSVCVCVCVFFLFTPRSNSCVYFSLMCRCATTLRSSSVARWPPRSISRASWLRP